MAHFTSISIDCGAIIFSYLEHREAWRHKLTSSLTRAFVRRSLELPRSLVFRYGKDGVPSYWLESVAKLCRNITSIDFGDKVYPAHVIRQACVSGHAHAVDVILRLFPHVDLKYYDFPKNARHQVEGIPLHLALCNGHLQIFNRLLRVERIEVGGLSGYSESLIHIAAAGGYVSTVNHLLTNHLSEFDINLVSFHPERHGTAIQCAARNGHIHVVKRLLEEPNLKQNANPGSALDRDLGTPLHLAVTRGFVKTAKILTEHLDTSECLNIHDASPPGMTLLQYASRHSASGFAFVMEALLNNDKYSASKEALHEAIGTVALYGSPEAMSILLNCKKVDSINFLSRRGLYDINAKMNHVFHTVVECGKIEIAKLLLEASNVHMALLRHSSSEQKDDQSQAPADTGSHSGSRAEAVGSTEFPVKSRLEFTIDFSRGENGGKYLAAAIMNDRIAMVEWLLGQAVIDVNGNSTANNRQRSALRKLAKRYGHKNIEKLLMKHEKMLKNSFQQK